MRTWAVGDVHGCRRTLENLLVQLDMKGWDKLVFLGDYIDRGSDSKGVIDIVKALEDIHGTDKIVALKGNHEDMCLHAYNYYDKGSNDYSLAKAWFYNGGNETCDSYPEGKVSKNHLDWMKSLRVRYEDDNCHYVHAGFNPYRDIEITHDYDFMWIRGEFILSEKDWGKLVIFGHTAQEGTPLIQSNKIGLDNLLHSEIPLVIYAYKLNYKNAI